MGQWTTAAKVGLFVVVVGAASILLYRFVSRTTGTAGGYTVFCELKDATGLAPQSRVMMAGIAVGTIKSIRLDRGMARVDIQMMPDIALHDDATVAKRSASICLRGEFRSQPSHGIGLELIVSFIVAAPIRADDLRKIIAINHFA